MVAQWLKAFWRWLVPPIVVPPLPYAVGDKVLLVPEDEGWNEVTAEITHEQPEGRFNRHYFIVSSHGVNLTIGAEELRCERFKVERRGMPFYYRVRKFVEE